jgi:nitroimidazol reductase NimA-like FMN-containing flavoprotein (pyridoxamine 5'-phosphate oxidase superfamily)
MKNSAAPKVSRPRLPREYGVPRSGTKGLLPWSHVSERMARAKHYWVCTVDPDARPHSTPVDGLWIDDCLYFGGSPQTRRHRNLARNPAACIHLESGADVVILHGDARLERPDRALATRLAKASNEKYGYGHKAQDYEKGGVTAFRPRVVFAWANLMKDATRWQF